MCACGSFTLALVHTALGSSELCWENTAKHGCYRHEILVDFFKCGLFNGHLKLLKTRSYYNIVHCISCIS